MSALLTSSSERVIVNSNRTAKSILFQAEYRLTAQFNMNNPENTSPNTIKQFRVSLFSYLAVYPFLAAACAFFIIFKYVFSTFASGDHGLQLAYIFWLQDSGAYPADIITSAFKHYHSFFLGAMSLQPDPDTFGVIYAQFQFISLFFTFFVLMIFSDRLTRSRTTAALTALAAAFLPIPMLAGSPVINHQFVPSSIAVPIIILAMILFFSGRYMSMCIALGVTFLIHPLEGAVAFLSLFLARCLLTNKTEWKKVLIEIGVFCLITLPMVFEILKSENAIAGASPLNSTQIKLWHEILRLRSPHHIFPFSWSVFTWLKFAMLLVVGGFGLKSFLSRQERPIHENAIYLRIKALVISISIICMSGLIFVEFIPSTAFLKAQPFRSTNLLIIIALPFTAYLISSTILNTLIKNYKMEILLIWIITIALFILLIFIPNKPIGVNAYENRDYFKTQIWARENTPEDALFWALPPLDNFRTLSQRSEFGSWKDGTLGNFAPEYAIKWWERMQEMGMQMNDEWRGYRGAARLNEEWKSPSTGQILPIILKHPIDYIVTQSKLPEDPHWQPEHQIGQIIIYRVIQKDVM